MKTTRILTSALAALLLANTIARAASFTWDGGGLFGSEWSRDNNWNPNTQPPSDGTADLFFAGANALDAEADMPWSIRSLTFNAGASEFTIQGNPLQVGSGGITNNGATAQNISNDLVLSAAQTFDTASTGSLDIFGAVNNSGHLLTVHLNTGPMRLFDSISGAGGLTKTGGGAVTLTGPANAYTGPTTINAGNFILFKAAGVTAIPGTLILNGGSVSVNADEQIANTSPVTLNTGALFTLQDVTETIGPLTLTAATVQLNAGALTTTSGMTMTGGTLDSGPTGTLTLGGNVVTNASANTATITPDVLNLGGATRTFNVNDGAAAIDAQLSSLSNGGLTKIGAGTLRLVGGAANTHTGLTRVNNGTLELSKPAGVNAIAGPLTVGDGIGSGVVKLLAADQIGSGAVTIDGGTLDLNGFAETLPAALTMDGGVINTGAGTLTLSNNVTTSVNGAAVPAINGNLNLGGGMRTFTVNDTAATATDLDVSAAIANGGFTKLGTGTLRFSGSDANTYNGFTFANVGRLELGKTAGVNAVAGPLVIGVGVLAAEVRLLASEQIGDTSNVTINQNAQLTGSGISETIRNLTLNGGTVNGVPLTLGGNLTYNALPETVSPSTVSLLNLDGATRTFNIADLTSEPVELFASSTISNGGIVKTGAGTLLLGANNTFAGGLAVNAGEVALRNNGAAGTGTLTLNTGASIRADAAARTLNNAVTLGGDATVGGALDLTLSGPMTLTGNRTVTVANTALTIFSGAIGQDANGRTLTKAGAGTLTISGQQNYGGLIVIGGTVNLNTPVGSGASTVAVTPGAGTTATVNFNTSQTLAALTIGAGGVVKLSAAVSAAAPPLELTEVSPFEAEQSTFADEAGALGASRIAAVHAVPEPGALSLLASMLLVLLRRLKRARP